jgi:predicted DNA-binding transcriptional regulator AlpA
MEKLTFDELPQAVAELSDKLDRIENLLKSKSSEQCPPKEELLTVEDTAKFLRLSVATVYGLSRKRDIPVLKRSKRIYFLRADLIQYLKQGRKKTNAEIAAIAQSHIEDKK